MKGLVRVTNTFRRMVLDGTTDDANQLELHGLANYDIKLIRSKSAIGQHKKRCTVEKMTKKRVY